MQKNLSKKLIIAEIVRSNLRLVFSIGLAVMLNGCSQNTTKLVNLKFFSFQTKTDSIYCLVKPDSLSGDLYLSKDLVAKYKFGYSIDNLAENEPRVVFMPQTDNPMMGFDSSLVDTTNLIITPNSNFDIDKFRKQNVYFIKVDGYNAKLVVPRNNGIGRIGVFIDSMKVQPGGVLQFNFYAMVKDSVEKELILDVIKSVMFSHLLL